MQRMRRTLRYVAIWCGATAVAISVSWFGVRGVLRNEFVDDVPFQPMAAQTLSAEKGAPVATATPTPRRTPAQKRTPVPTPAPAKGDVKVVTVKGGEVAFVIGAKGCKLVSATPNGGYTAKVTGNAGWIRVDLAKGEHGSGVWCISAEQRTDTWEY